MAEGTPAKQQGRSVYCMGTRDPAAKLKTLEASAVMDAPLLAESVHLAGHLDMDIPVICSDKGCFELKLDLYNSETACSVDVTAHLDNLV